MCAKEIDIELLQTNHDLISITGDMSCMRGKKKEQSTSSRRSSNQTHKLMSRRGK